MLRHRRGWRQVDLAVASHVSRERVALVENGGANHLSLGELRAMFEALDASVDILVRWRGEGLDRLLDAGHASLVDAVVGLLRGSAWETAVEATINVYGERGSMDVLAWYPQRSTALVVEVKTVIPDLQAMLQTLDRKVRLAPVVARERGWKPAAVGRLLVVGEGRTTRRRIAEHGAILGGAFPTRGNAARAWLRRPTEGAFSGLILLPVEPAKRVGRRRIRRPDEAPDEAPPWTERSEAPGARPGARPAPPANRQMSSRQPLGRPRRGRRARPITDGRSDVGSEGTGSQEPTREA